MDIETSEAIVATAFFASQSRNLPAAVKIEEGVAALLRNLPGRRLIVYHLSRTYGAAFYQAVARVAPRMTDDQLYYLARSIGSEIGGGRADPRAAGLEEIRAEVARRPNLPSWAKIPRERAPGR
jgi:hypothetical protein